MYTVIKYQSSHEIILDSKEWHHKEGYNLGALTQDGISFKAGYEKRDSEFVYNPDYLDCQKGVKTGREFGRREVVELISADTNNFELPISLGCIAKLKEWGSKEVR